jgi:hypothetical protein
MPSRLGILAIVIFWLISTSCLIVREIVPLFRTGEPPAFFTDVTTDVGGTVITWKILHKGEGVGTGFSQVTRRHDRSYELISDLRFENLGILKTVEIKKIAGRYLVDKSGSLKELATEVKAVISTIGEVKAEIKGVVQDGVLTPRFFLDGAATDLGIFQPQPLRIATHGNVLNTMHLLNRIPGLRVGRSWKVPQLDPMGLIMPAKQMATKILIAEVAVDELEWQGKMVRCYRIDYSEPGQKATAHTWVRRGDGLVLQQAAKHGDQDLVLVREVNK